MRACIIFLLTLTPVCALSQELSGSELLDRSISYHDPEGKWSTFSDRFYVTMTTPNRPERLSEIIINLPREYFYLKATRDETSVQYTLDRDRCVLSLNDKAEFTQAEAEEHNVTCERGTMYKNYYTYLYGLPMKLKDPGSHVDPKTEVVTFKGKKYLRLKVTYDENVGTDVWFFYFDPETYAMEVYQFYKGNPEGKGKDTGEYILLSEEAVIGGIKMPKVRAWYYNKDDKYLGTDTLNDSK